MSRRCGSRAERDSGATAMGWAFQHYFVDGSGGDNLTVMLLSNDPVGWFPGS